MVKPLSAVAFAVYLTISPTRKPCEAGVLITAPDACEIDDVSTGTDKALIGAISTDADPSLETANFFPSGAIKLAVFERPEKSKKSFSEPSASLS